MSYFRSNFTYEILFFFVISDFKKVYFRSFSEVNFFLVLGYFRSEKSIILTHFLAFFIYLYLTASASD